LQVFLLEEIWVRKDTKKGPKPIGTYQGTLTVDKLKKQQAGKLDGFWLLVTNHSERGDTGFEKNTRDVVEPYREKVVIESSFRDIKSFVEVAPVHVMDYPSRPCALYALRIGTPT